MKGELLTLAAGLGVIGVGWVHLMRGSRDAEALIASTSGSIRALTSAFTVRPFDGDLAAPGEWLPEPFGWPFKPVKFTPEQSRRFHELELEAMMEVRGGIAL